MSIASQSIQDRQIRIFISSTFCDMKEERDHLVKSVFPRLRRLCEARGVIWNAVDLRWGVGDEQAADGQVLPICLEEIKRCRPYFIGLLGERYGWTPDTIPPEVIEREPWLREHVYDRTSVTELEILHGVLNNPKTAEHAYFYFRDPKYIETVPADKRSEFISEDAQSAGKLKMLKQRIRDNKLTVREDYAGPEALGELILKDMTAMIDQLYPEDSQPDPLTREEMDHEAYAASLAQGYIGREGYYHRLNEHAASNDTQPLVILGESGSGRSALLASWVFRYRKQHPEALVIQHYLGASSCSADWAAMLRRIMGELKRSVHIEEDIPSKLDELRDAFNAWLYRAAAKRKVILILDALNQLADIDHAPDLLWLPSDTPGNLRLLISTLPGRAMDEIRRRNWPVLAVELPKEGERRKLIHDYLNNHGKELGAACVDRIARAPQSTNLLYLRMLLDELRVSWVHEKLDERVEHYLKAQNPFELYGKVIARWEEDYGKGTSLVADTLSLLWAARRGLSESELLEAMGSDGRPLPRAKWSPLCLAMSDSLVSQDGLLTFASDFLRVAARDAFIPTEGRQRDVRLRLADYFERMDIGPRQVDELPWLLQQAGERDRLRDCLLHIDRFRLMWESTAIELFGYWVWLGQEREMGRLYLQSFRRWKTKHSKDTEALGSTANALGVFLYHAAQYAEAGRLYRWALEIWERSLGEDHPDVATVLSNLGVLYHETNRLAEAEPLMKRAVAIDEARFGKDHPHVATDLNNLAMLYQDTNRLMEAEMLMKRALAIVEASFGKDHPRTAVALNNLAQVYDEMNRLAEAEPLMERVLAIEETSLGKDHPSVARDLNNLAALYERTDRSAEAELLMKRAVAIDEASFGKDHPAVAVALNNLARLYQDTNRLAEAEPLMKRHLVILVEVSVQSGHNHLHLNAAAKHYARLLIQMGYSQEQAITKVRELFRCSFGRSTPSHIARGGGGKHPRYTKS